MSARSDAPVVKQAWAHASRLSTDGLLHDAVMEFLRIRYVISTACMCYMCAAAAGEWLVADEQEWIQRYVLYTESSR